MLPGIRRTPRTPPDRVLVLAFALLGATLGGAHGAAPAPGAGIPPAALVAGATRAAGGLAGVEGSGVDVNVNYCTGCAAARSATQQTG